MSGLNMSQVCVIKLIEKPAFEDLNLYKLNTYAFDNVSPFNYISLLIAYCVLPP